MIDYKIKIGLDFMPEAQAEEQLKVIIDNYFIGAMPVIKVTKGVTNFECQVSNLANHSKFETDIEAVIDTLNEIASFTSVANAAIIIRNNAFGHSGFGLDCIDVIHAIGLLPQVRSEAEKSKFHFLMI